MRSRSSSGRRALTYAALDARANQLAHHLRPSASAPKCWSASAMERSPDLVVALLGILKAGGRLLSPSTPTTPRRDWHSCCDDAAPAVLRHDHGPRSRRPTRDGRPAIRLDVEAGGARPGGRRPIAACSATGESLAYVMYTSGSTGKPKGVVHPPSRRRPPRERRLTTSASGRDELFLQLAPIVVRCLHLRDLGRPAQRRRGSCSPRRGALDSADAGMLAPAPRRHHAVAHGRPLPRASSTSDLDDLARRPRRSAGRRRRALAAARARASRAPGAASHQRLRAHRKHDVHLFHDRYRRCARTDSIPIGRPIANTRVLCARRAAAPGAVGVPGELYIGGDGLAPRLPAPSRADGRAIRRPTRSRPSRRRGSTAPATSCRYRADGNLEFLGRLDAR